MRGVWFITRSFFDAGGMEEVFTTMALELQLRGVRVHVFLRDPVRADNAYFQRLLRAGVRVSQPPSWEAVDRVVLGLTTILAPIAVGVAVCRSLLLWRPIGESWSQVRGRTQWILASLLHRDLLMPILRAHLLLNRPDVVHTHHTDAAWAIAWCARKKLPCVHSEHSTPSIDHVDWADLSRTGYLATHLTAVSTVSADALRRVCRTVAPITVLEQPLEDPCTNRTRLASASAESPPVIVCVARLSDEKGIADLIRAMAVVVAAVPGCHLNLVGDGPQRSELEGIAVALGVHDRVTFLGNLTRRAVIDHLLASTVVALPSHLEGKPISLIEAMACGRPIVASAVGGTPELIDDGVTGRLVPPGDPRALADALTELLLAPEMRVAMGAAARTRFEQGGYAPTAVVDALLEIYTTALRRPNPPLPTSGGRV